MPAQPTSLVPTLAEIQGETCWFGSIVKDKAVAIALSMALAPLMIRWGLDTSGDTLRRSAKVLSMRSQRCGDPASILVSQAWGLAVLPFQNGWLP
jgi:hypothetical protein